MSIGETLDLDESNITLIIAMIQNKFGTLDLVLGSRSMFFGGGLIHILSPIEVPLGLIFSKNNV